MAETDYDNQENLEELDEHAEAAPPPRSGLRTLIVGLVAIAVIGGAVYGFFQFNKKDPSLAKRFPGMSQSASNDLPKKIKKNRKIKYAKLYTIPADQATGVLKELSLLNIPFNSEQSGKNYVISVDDTRIEDARNLLAMKGLPEGAARGYALLDSSQTLGVTEFDKRIRFVRALSGELEKAISQFEMIENCKVQIVLPEQRLFSVTQPPVTASILVRKIPGTELTDDVVFSIIQLVANAVENLQPENVSVIDTEGKVLSNGIFERMAAKEAGILKEKKPSQNVRPETALGNPIIPNFEDIKKWQEVKLRFEKSLEDKATQQLLGILPEESFKIAISSELGPLANGDIVDIKRLTISIVVDNQRSDIYLDPLLKKQIFNTIASATGYVRGRDTIQLNKADFKVAREAAKRKRELKQKLLLWAKRGLLYLPYPIGAVVAFFGIRWIYRFFKKKLAALNEEEEPEDLSNFTELKEEMDGKKQIEQIQSIAAQEPEVLAEIIEKWLHEEKT